MKTRNYGERVCLECGKKFNATYLQQVCCSDECKKARQAKSKRECAKARWPKHRAMVEELKKNLDAALLTCKELKEEVEQLTHANKKLHDALSDALATQRSARREVVQSSKNGKQWCERLKLKADELPCGDRSECFVNPTCDKATKNG